MYEYLDAHLIMLEGHLSCNHRPFHSKRQSYACIRMRNLLLNLDRREEVDRKSLKQRIQMVLQ